MTLLCDAIDAEASTGSCPAEGRIGGCSEDVQGLYTTIDWVYEGGDEQSVEDIECSSGDVRVDADGDPMLDPSVACSRDGGASIDVTFANDAATTVTLFWVDTGCGETGYHVLTPGQTVDQATYTEHVWRARAGDSDPAGTLLWEHRIADGDQLLSVQ